MKKIIISFILLTAVLFTFGCSKGNDQIGDRYGGDSGGGQVMRRAPVMAVAENLSLEMSNDMKMSDSSDPAPSATIPESAVETPVERKLVKRANISVRVENLVESNKAVLKLLEQYNGYSASTSISENSYYYSLRIPVQFYDVFLSDANGLGKLLHSNENTEDVTLRYYDLEGRLATKRELMRTFQSYLRRANSIEEILAVEARISELQYDIESTAIQLRNLANRVEYATIDLSLQGPVASYSGGKMSFGERMAILFGSFGGFITGLIIFLFGFVIFGVPILLLLVFIFWLFFGKIGMLRRVWQIVKAPKVS